MAPANTKIPTVAAAVASGVNMNEWVHESIECSGSGTGPYTDAQFESVAQLIAAGSHALDLPINRSTVVVTPTSHLCRACFGPAPRPES